MNDEKRMLHELLPYKHDVILKKMIKDKLPLTIDTYISLNWPGTHEENLGPEEIEEIPRPLRE